jgi:L-aspartate oxidase
MRVVEADFAVVGSGIAGLWFSRRVAESGTVALITKKAGFESNTNYAQGGIAAAVSDDDSPEFHLADTLAAGGGIARPEVVRMVTETGPRLVRELHELGIAFSTHALADGVTEFDLGMEGGHRRRRIVHAQDLTGREIERGLLDAVRSSGRVTIYDDCFAREILVDERGRCRGVVAFETASGEELTVVASVVLLATGGIGRVYRFTTNPPVATGDGVAMAFRAGARIANMEFIQFHPTSLYGFDFEDRAFLISEAVRGEGAVLLTRSGHRFMPGYHPDSELAPRDVVARAIAAELARSGDESVLLDATRIGAQKLRERFPTILGTCRELGIDITREPIPVVPAAHYVCGGVATNDWAETSVPAMFAAGECACSGLHGANRLASNSLLEALVMADRAAVRATASTVAVSRCRGVPGSVRAMSSIRSEGIVCAASVAELRASMWEHAGIVRSDAGLAAARASLRKIERRRTDAQRSVSCLESRNLLTVAALVVECALRRRESRGLHYNIDHPMPVESLEHDTIVDSATVDVGN